MFRFLQGSLKNKEPHVEKRVVNESTEVAVALGTTLTIRNMVIELDVARNSVQRILKTHYSHLYKIYLLQLHKEDGTCRFVNL